MNRLRRNNALAPIGLYATQRNAGGISMGMIMALNITADNMADCGLCRSMMFNALNAGMDTINKAGTIAKYLATSLAIEKVVKVPRVISNCFPISTISISLVGSLSRSTMLAASLAA